MSNKYRKAFVDNFNYSIWMNTFCYTVLCTVLCVLSLQDSLTAGSLIITVSRDKPCWLARYNCKGWS